jgi:hypothetical protein
MIFKNENQSFMARFMPIKVQIADVIYVERQGQIIIINLRNMGVALAER